jgi:hypothetical protein
VYELIAEMETLNVAIRGVTDVTIEDLVITAADVPAILARRVESLRIDRNRIVMQNARNFWPSIYASGTEIHIVTPMVVPFAKDQIRSEPMPTNRRSSSSRPSQGSQRRSYGP